MMDGPTPMMDGSAPAVSASAMSAPAVSAPAMSAPAMSAPVPAFGEGRNGRHGQDRQDQG